uniref:Uncharacterized protein n=1 Tax=Trichogramma kaykai TaxID=54128 RepID=A0ABD2XL74_9HYME
MRQRVVNPLRTTANLTPLLSRPTRSDVFIIALLFFLFVDRIDTGVLSRRLREDLLAEQRQRRARGLQVAARQVSASQSRPQPVIQLTKTAMNGYKIKKMQWEEEEEEEEDEEKSY